MVNDLETVCVYCASSPRTKAAFTNVAGELGAALAAAGLTLLYGGGAVGMMGALADAALASGGRVVGVRPEFISRFESAHAGVAEMIFVETMHQRKAILLERGDAFVALPGAIGTIDELVETITWKRLGLHDKPICVVNPDGFFDPLLNQFRRLVDEQLIAEEFLSIFAETHDAAGTMAYLQSYAPETATPVMWRDP
jgi:uncharacterized protein (TIGR00730 family)